MNEVAVVLTVMLAIGALAIALGVMLALRAAGDSAAPTVTAPNSLRRRAERRPRTLTELRSHA
jgi:hypothetical protein